MLQRSLLFQEQQGQKPDLSGLEWVEAKKNLASEDSCFGEMFDCGWGGDRKVDSWKKI